MRCYLRSKKIDMMDTINLCYFDADNGRVSLSLERLRDLEEEIGEDAKICYAEGLIRKDFLGQGINAYQLFEKAYTLDPHHSLAACNSAMYAPDEQKFRKWAKIATKLSPQDKESFESAFNLLDNDITYWEFLYQTSNVNFKEKNKLGDSAAYMELALLASEMDPGLEVNARRGRAQILRLLDEEAEKKYETRCETFPPKERLSLHEAMNEIDRAISLDKYDPELWNLKAAWNCLLEQYKKAISCADRAIELRPYNYPKPYQNKANALWNLNEHTEALVCARIALKQAQDCNSLNDVEIAKLWIEICSNPVQTPTLKDFEPIIGKILKAAEITSDQETGLMKGSIQNIIDSFLFRIKPLQHARSSIEYIAAMGQLFSYVTAESAFCTIHRIGITDRNIQNHCINATLYIVAHSEKIMRRDAARFLILSIFALRDSTEIKRLYRKLILETSAAASDEMSRIDILVREELSRIHSLFPEMIANQEPIDDDELKHANNTIISQLIGTPFINNSSQFGAKFEYRYGCFILLIVILLILYFLAIN